MHDRARITRREAVLRKIRKQRDNVMFLPEHTWHCFYSTKQVINRGRGSAGSINHSQQVAKQDCVVTTHRVAEVEDNFTGIPIDVSTSGLPRQLPAPAP